MQIKKVRVKRFLLKECEELLPYTYSWHFTCNTPTHLMKVYEQESVRFHQRSTRRCKVKNYQLL